MRVAPELAEKLFEHYPQLELQLDGLVHVTHEMECLVERANAIFSDSGIKVSMAIERAREAASIASIPVSVPPPPASPPALETPPAKAVVAVNESIPNVAAVPCATGGASPEQQSTSPIPIPEKGKDVLNVSGKLLRRCWR